MSDLDIGRYSKVSRRIWSDARFKRLSPPPPSGQFLFLRLLTAPELGTIPGVICAGEAGLAEALGWTVEGFRKAFAEAFREGLVKADWKARLVVIPKALRHNKPASPNVVRSWKNTWAEAPECELKTETWHILRDLAEGFGEGFAKAFVEACPKPSPNQEQEQEQEQEEGERERDGALRLAAIAAPPVVVRSAKASTPKKSSAGSRGTRLSPEWRPSAGLIARFRAKRVDAMGSFERFQSWALSATGRNAVKADWDQAFNGWVLRDIADGKATPLAELDELPILRLPNRDALLKHDLANAPDMTGASFGGTHE